MRPRRRALPGSLLRRRLLSLGLAGLDHVLERDAAPGEAAGVGVAGQVGGVEGGVGGPGRLLVRGDAGFVFFDAFVFGS